MVLSLELREDALNSDGRGPRPNTSSGSAFIADSRKNYMKNDCLINEKSMLVKQKIFYNPKSKNHRPTMKPSDRIMENLKKKGLTEDSTTADE